MTAMLFVAAPARAQRYVDGVFLGNERGDIVELIAWAERRTDGSLSMSQGSLEDVPVVPHTHRILFNLGGWNLFSVFVSTDEVFSTPLDRIESRDAPFTRLPLGVSTIEITIPTLDKRESVERLQKVLKARTDKPLYAFLFASNGVVGRYYPIRLQ
jgi:hypothetical protein